MPPLAVRRAAAGGRAVGRARGRRAHWRRAAAASRACTRTSSSLLRPYLAALLWSAPPLLVFTVFRRYLQAMDVVRPVLVARRDREHRQRRRQLGLRVRPSRHAGDGRGGIRVRDAGRAHRTWRCSCWRWSCARERRRPSGLHDVPFGDRRGADVGTSSRLGRAGGAAVDAGGRRVRGGVRRWPARISPLAVAANQIVLNIAGFFFMVPFGLSSAAAVRVGQAVGRGDPAGVRVARAGARSVSAALVAP